MGISDFAAASPQLDALVLLPGKPNKELGEAGIAIVLGTFRADNNFDEKEKLLFRDWSTISSSSFLRSTASCSTPSALS